MRRLPVSLRGRDEQRYVIGAGRLPLGGRQRLQGEHVPVARLAEDLSEPAQFAVEAAVCPAFQAWPE